MRNRSLKGETTFCVTARSGLGHLRRVTNIAGALKRLSPAAHLGLLINAAPSCLSREEEQLFEHIEVVERQSMARALACRPSGPIVVDTAVIPDLAYVARPLCLVLRETVAEKLAAFHLPGGREWDCVIVPSPSADWSVDPGDVGAKVVVNVGWIYRDRHAAGGRKRRGTGGQKKTVLVATGAGGGAESNGVLKEIDDVVAQLREKAGDSINVVQAVGPRAKSMLKNVDEARDVGGNLDKAFAEADLILTTVGYNSILELACTETPVMMFPIERTYDDQFARAMRWEARLGHLHRPGLAGASATWAAQTLKDGKRRPAIEIGPSGCGLSAELIDRLASDAVSAETPYIFEKRLSTAHAGSGARIARNSVNLFGAGIMTLPGIATTGGEALRFARIEGDNARSLIADRRADVSSVDFSDIEPLLADVLRPLAALHAIAPSQVEAPAAQPWQKVTPRVAALGPDREARLGDQVQRLIEHQRQFLGRSLLPGRQPSCIVHGDFHCGQLIRPRGASGFLLMDLDDLAIGCAEADIGNFVAHLVTSPDLYAANAYAGFRVLAATCIALYQNCSERRLNEALVDYFGSISLLRRALKLVERDPKKFSGIEEALQVAELIFERCKPKFIPDNGHVLSGPEPVHRRQYQAESGSKP